MPRTTKETTLLAVYGDVHYFFSDRERSPTYDRFEKGCYIYLHHDPQNGHGRWEIANRPGTEYQDAVAGCMWPNRWTISPADFLIT